MATTLQVDSADVPLAANRPISAPWAVHPARWGNFSAGSIQWVRRVMRSRQTGRVTPNLPRGNRTLAAAGPVSQGQRVETSRLVFYQS